MGKFYTSLQPKLQDFIQGQKIFFVSTAPKEGRINLSPKGYDSLWVIDENQLIFANLVGSGNETAGHLLEDDRITIMFCSFESEPMILKIYGRGRAIHPEDPEHKKWAAQHPPLEGLRQWIHIQIESVQTSCGDGVPFFDYQGERNSLKEWIQDKGEKGIKNYQDKNNRQTIDGKPTGLP